jgi:hypothetical protein
MSPFCRWISDNRAVTVLHLDTKVKGAKRQHNAVFGLLKQRPKYLVSLRWILAELARAKGYT